MLLDIIKKLEDELIVNNGLENFQESYQKKKDIDATLIQLEKQIASLNAQKEIVNDLNAELREITKKQTQLQRELGNIELPDNILSLFNKLNNLKNMEWEYLNGNYKAIYEYLANYFDFDFNNIIDFCCKNNILLNFSNLSDYEFLNHLIKEGKYKNESKISSLDELMLTRKTMGLPKNDELIAPIKFLTESKTREIKYDGKTYNINMTLPTGHSTIHWALGHEVTPHSGTFDLSYCDTIILQPVTEKIYAEAESLYGTDCFFFNKMELDDYYVICDSVEKANQIIKDNKKATPIVFEPSKINGSGNLILTCLGKKLDFSIYDGWVSGVSNGMPLLKDLFEEEFFINHPKISDSHNGPGSKKHNCYIDVLKLTENIQVIDFLNNCADTKNSFELAFDSLNEAYKNNVFYLATFNEIKQQNIQWRELLPANYLQMGVFIDNIVNCDLDAEKIFEELLRNIEISETNYNSLLKIKEKVIKLIEELNSHKDHAFDYEKLYDEYVAQIIFLRRIVESNIINKKANIDNLDIPIKYYDFSKFDNLLDNYIFEGLGQGKDMENLTMELVTAIYENDNTNFYDIPLSNSNNTDANMIIDILDKNVDNYHEMVSNLESMDIPPYFIYFIEIYYNSKDKNDKIKAVLQMVAATKAMNIDLIQILNPEEHKLS